MFYRQKQVSLFQKNAGIHNKTFRVVVLLIADDSYVKNKFYGYM